MRKIVYAAAAPLAVAAGLVLSGTNAFASTPVPGGNGQTGQLTGNGAAAYPDPVFGPVQCNETQHQKFDTVECQFTGGQTRTPGATGTVGWLSDFNGQLGTLTYQIKPDGSGYTAKATY